MALAGVFFSFAFAFLSGYTFFNTSSMIIIVVLNVVLIKEIEELRDKRKE